MKAKTIKELLAWQPPQQQYIIDKGIFLPQSKLILFGRWQTWKSMLVIHTAITLATGNPWFGYNTKQSSVYVLQTEIAEKELRTRIHKYVTNNQLYPDNVYLRTEHYIKLDKAYGGADVEKELKESIPQVLIIDPIYSVMSGKIVDEYDIRKLTDWINIIIDRYKVAVILVHHDRKPIVVGGEIYTSADDMFGSSILLDWCDTSIRTTNTNKDGEVILSFEKVRHAEDELKPIRVRITRATLKFETVPQ
jgi:RecA-family ATPase